MLLPTPRITHSTAADGYRFAVRVWAAQGAAAPRASVVCLHGIISHGGWYHPSCRELARAGCEVHFLDRRGSGLNRAGRGDVDRWQTWPADVEGYLAGLPDGPPRALLGISWGGKLAAAVARRRPELVDALGFLCPGLFAKKGANAVQRAALKLAAVVGLKCLRVTVPLRDPALFTGHARWQAYVGADPLALRKVTVRFALADLELTCYATEAPEQIEPKAALLVLAGRDRIIDNARVRRYFERLGAAERRVIEYPEATHTLEFEPDPTRYLRELRDWVGAVAGD